MLIQDNLVLSRAEPNGEGGTQLLYRVESYGISALSRPQEDTSRIHWEVDVIKYLNEDSLKHQVCHSTELADKTLRLSNDSALNEFLQKAFGYFKELNTLEKMLPEETGS